MGTQDSRSLDEKTGWHYEDIFVFFSSRRRHTRCSRDWSSDVCSSDLKERRAWHPPRFTQSLAIRRGGRRNFIAQCHRKTHAASRAFARAPRQYSVNPRTIAATVPPTNFISNPNLSDESPGGTSETRIPIRTIAKPVPETIHTPALPPG